MNGLYPLVFEPRYKERVWGGRTLERLYGRRLPAGVPIGESWDVSDRPGDESVVADGPLAGATLRSLMETRREEVLGGASTAAGERFPLLCKILDARDRLSLQVHPPTVRLGEPKTEMWYVAQADPGAELHVGLRRGVTRQEFESKIREGRVAECFHRIPVREADAMFLPSGRVHAIGAGLVIFEIQQNSDTTFRVHDWDRVGLDGKPRALHVAESLESIDFSDVEPALIAHDSRRAGAFSVRPLVRHALFDADLIRAESKATMAPSAGLPAVLALVNGAARVSGGGMTQPLSPGQFALLPAAVSNPTIDAEAGAAFLLSTPK